MVPVVKLSINVFGVRFVDIELDIPPADAVEVDRIARRGVRALSRWWAERMF
ncbi:Uncharacterised protein [Mycobacteroides abscessus subsp. bolletii]|nr:Uncharacterised protein [Mycobacteroides abscessus subsp. bolletii]SKT76714.1 Uncharacterised protein [Mycobacteroides abscessus subsp. bolletii]SLD35052.1 Uncharacterised protein [Mycobacteroides abscessus subsp. bolletii]SLF79767.1 Uncharacterised protein [Mycobacteroides abscessus subsp. bolletii]